jgi:hypothetical protein
MKGYVVSGNDSKQFSVKSFVALENEIRRWTWCLQVLSGGRRLRFRLEARKQVTDSFGILQEQNCH